MWLLQHPIQLVFLIFVAATGLRIRKNLVLHQRAQFIREAPFPKGLLQKLIAKHPKLTMRDAELVAKALRQFFLVYHRSRYQYVAMPSEVVDDLWHEFILYTRNYEQFCKQAFGRFFHHTPAVVLGADKQNNTGLRRTWWHACKEENINPRNATRLPLLFAIDAKLGIENGRTYSLNCQNDSHLNGGGTCCVGDFSSSSVDGSVDGFGDSSSDGGGGGADGGDGGGCGGGCGGGGD